MSNHLDLPAMTRSRSASAKPPPSPQPSRSNSRETSMTQAQSNTHPPILNTKIPLKSHSLGAKLEKSATQSKNSNHSSFIHSIHGPGPHIVNPKNNLFSNDTNLVQLRQCMHCLEECSWYKGHMSKRKAKETLRRCRPGSFLLRDSDNPQYLFSLSQNLHFVGPIATRIFFQDGLFWFDDGKRNIRDTTASSSPRPAFVAPSDSEKSGREDNLAHPNNSASYSGQNHSLGFSCVVSLIEHWAKMYLSKNIMALRYPLDHDNQPILDGMELNHKCQMDAPRSEFGSFPNLPAAMLNSNSGGLGYPKKQDNSNLPSLANSRHNSHSISVQETNFPEEKQLLEPTNSVQPRRKSKKKKSFKKIETESDSLEAIHKVALSNQNSVKMNINAFRPSMASPKPENSVLPANFTDVGSDAGVINPVHSTPKVNSHKKLGKQLATPVLNNNIPIGDRELHAAPQIFEAVTREEVERISHESILSENKSSKNSAHSNHDQYFESNTSVEAQQNSSGMNIIVDMNKILADKTQASTQEKFSEIHKHNLMMSAIEEATDEEYSRREVKQRQFKFLSQSGRSGTDRDSPPVPVRQATRMASYSYDSRGSPLVSPEPIKNHTKSLQEKMKDLINESKPSRILTRSMSANTHNTRRDSNPAFLEEFLQGRRISKDEVNREKSRSPRFHKREKRSIKVSDLTKDSFKNIFSDPDANHSGSHSPEKKIYETVADDQETVLFRPQPDPQIPVATLPQPQPQVENRGRSPSKKSNPGREIFIPQHLKTETKIPRTSSLGGSDVSSKFQTYVVNSSGHTTNPNTNLQDTNNSNNSSKFDSNYQTGKVSSGKSQTSQSSPVNLSPKLAPANTITCPHCANLIMIPFYTTSQLQHVNWNPSLAVHPPASITKSSSTLTTVQPLNLANTFSKTSGLSFLPTTSSTILPQDKKDSESQTNNSEAESNISNSKQPTQNQKIKKVPFLPPRNYVDPVIRTGQVTTTSARSHPSIPEKSALDEPIYSPVADDKSVEPIYSPVPQESQKSFSPSQSQTSSQARPVNLRHVFSKAPSVLSAHSSIGPSASQIPVNHLQPKLPSDTTSGDQDHHSFHQKPVAPPRDFPAITVSNPSTVPGTPRGNFATLPQFPNLITPNLGVPTSLNSSANLLVSPNLTPTNNYDAFALFQAQITQQINQQMQNFFLQQQQQMHRTLIAQPSYTSHLSHHSQTSLPPINYQPNPPSNLIPPPTNHGSHHNSLQVQNISPNQQTNSNNSNTVSNSSRNMVQSATADFTMQKSHLITAVGTSSQVKNTSLPNLTSRKESLSKYQSSENEVDISKLKLNPRNPYNQRPRKDRSQPKNKSQSPMRKAPLVIGVNRGKKDSAKVGNIGVSA